MFQLLLTRRYLTSKIMPLLASLAVALCTAMVLIVWSVMGGFLSLLINSGRGLVGDVVVSWPNVGLRYYDDLVARLRADPEIEAATAMIETFGQVQLPDGRVESALLKGIDPVGYARVTNYADSLWWRPLAQPLPRDTEHRDPRLDATRLMQQLLDDGLALREPDRVKGQPVSNPKPAAVLGIEFSGANQRMPSGIYLPYTLQSRGADGSVRTIDMLTLPIDGSIVVSVLPTDGKGLQAIDVKTRRFPVANEFHSGLYEFDKNVVFVEFTALQEMVGMNAARRVVEPAGRFETSLGPDGVERLGGPVQTVIEPARATTILVRGKFDPRVRASTDAKPADELALRVQRIYVAFAQDHPGAVPDAQSIRIMTWRDQNRTMIAAVEKETALVLFLFLVISFVAVFLVLAIFWAMISEKTRDIGVLRALGASRVSVAGLWLAYGIVLGLLGSAAGGILAYLVVSNINPIHDWMGRALGVQVWDPRIYYFTTIPTDMDAAKAAIVLVGGVLSAALGALWPAVRAALMHPVKALRFE